MNETVQILNEYVLPNPWQPRESEDPEHIKALALSIANEGLMQIPVGRWVFPDGRPLTEPAGSGEARPEQVKGKPVEVIAVANVHAGSLILVDSRLCACGMWFIPKCWNQVDHCAEGKRLRLKIEKQMRTQGHE